ncbi:hypothetical protein [Streptomyces sp. enrichment culture]|uniref:hypothetical protein n=1 Tax=Streptomyces sp. enrichment culture TaxID=1795815 RepID=UPI003F54A492
MATTLTYATAAFVDQFLGFGPVVEAVDRGPAAVPCRWRIRRFAVLGAVLPVRDEVFLDHRQQVDRRVEFVLCKAGGVGLVDRESCRLPSVTSSATPGPVKWACMPPGDRTERLVQFVHRLRTEQLHAGREDGVGGSVSRSPLGSFVWISRSLVRVCL